MYFFNRLEKILKAATGCGFRNTGSTSAYERYVETFPMQAGVEQCYDELADTAMMELINTGNMITELQGTELAAIIESLVLDALKLDVQRVCWFGDRSLADANYNQMDGVWKKLINSPAEMPKVTVATGALATGDAIDILNTMYKAQTKELRGMPNNSKAFYVTTDLYEAYQEDLENAGGGDAGRQALIDGNPMLAYRGIPVIEQARWNGILADDLAVADTNRVLLTTPLNLIIATDMTSAAGSDMAIKIFSDDLEEKMYITSRMKLGTDYVHESMSVVGSALV